MTYPHTKFCGTRGSASRFYAPRTPQTPVCGQSVAIMNFLNLMICKITRHVDIIR